MREPFLKEWPMIGKLAEFLLTLAAPRRRDRAVGDRRARRPGAPAEQASGSTARSLAEAIDRAMELGLWAHADRLAQTAARLADCTPRLCERLARLRLIQGRAETALAIIDGCRPMCASLRLLRAACLIQLGRAAEAQMDLRSWSLKSTAPLAARRLLALLEWDAGDSEGAQNTLMRNLRHLEDPHTLEILLVIAASQNRTALASQWADRLMSASLVTQTALPPEILLTSIDMAASHEPAAPTTSQIQTLAIELLSIESVIPALVETQRLHPQPAQAALLYGALEEALPELANGVTAHEALARLALILNKHDVAETWAQRGLALNPMSASLALLLEESRRERAAGRQALDAEAAGIAGGAGGAGDEDHIVGSIGDAAPAPESKPAVRITGRAA